MKQRKMDMAKDRAAWRTACKSKSKPQNSPSCSTDCKREKLNNAILFFIYMYSQPTLIYKYKINNNRYLCVIHVMAGRSAFIL